MRFLDRPMVTAGLGIAFALLLLAVLSSPTLLGNLSNSPSSAGPLFGPANANLVASSSNSGTTPSSSSVSSITTFTASSAVSSAQSVSSGTGYSYTSSSTATVTAYTTIVANFTTTNATASTGSVQSGTTGTPPNASAITSMTTVQQGGTTASVSTVVTTNAGIPAADLAYFYNRASLTKNLLGSLGVLSAVSLAIALGSMFYVRRKFNSDSEEK